MKQLKTYAFAGAFITAQLLSAGTVLAGTANSPKITATTSIKSLNILSETEKQAISLSAGRILIHTDKARLAITDKNSKKAKKEVSQGLKLINIIENALPKYKTITDIKAGNEHYYSEEDSSQRYVTVFDEQYFEDIITPVTNAKKDKKL